MLAWSHTERDGVLGGGEPNVPAYWNYSVNIARAWELALSSAQTPDTRRVALRFGFTMSPDRGGVFDWLMWLVRRGLGGPFYGGGQYVSWVTDVDVVRAMLHVLHDASISGPVNVTAPTPITNRAFMATLRRHAGVGVGLPVWPGIAEVGAMALGTDVELMRKSRRVVPDVLVRSGFAFRFPEWDGASRSLVDRWRRGERLTLELLHEGETGSRAS